MTTEQIITLAKEKLGKDITEQEAQDYIDGKAALPDEALEIVSGGAVCVDPVCTYCGSHSCDVSPTNPGWYLCNGCGKPFRV